MMRTLFGRAENVPLRRTVPARPTHAPGGSIKYQDFNIRILSKRGNGYDVSNGELVLGDYNVTLFTASQWSWSSRLFLGRNFEDRPGSIKSHRPWLQF